MVPCDYFTNNIGMAFRLIHSGSFTMGSDHDWFSDVRYPPLVHEVRISRDFMIGVFPVTQGEFNRVVGINPSRHSGSNRPVDSVSWGDAVKFCDLLGNREGRTYRLPTEAEWEYSCRAGSTSMFSFGDEVRSFDLYGWWACNSSDTTQPVGLKLPNAWGLHDMHGNLYEWCEDWLGDYPQSCVDDPNGPKSGLEKVQRGGSYFVACEDCSSAARRSSPPGRGYRGTGTCGGFRVVLEID
jgi:formylglycine-generating enzyme required for sulfatase activity